MAAYDRTAWLASSNADKFADLADLLETPLTDLYASRDAEESTPEDTPEDIKSTGTTRKGGTKSG